MRLNTRRKLIIEINKKVSVQKLKFLEYVLLNRLSLGDFVVVYLDSKTLDNMCMLYVMCLYLIFFN